MHKTNNNRKFKLSERNSNGLNQKSFMQNIRGKFTKSSKNKKLK